jgi:hypothetical protein
MQHLHYHTEDGNRVASTWQNGHPNLQYWTMTTPRGTWVPICMKFKDLVSLYPPKDDTIIKTTVYSSAAGRDVEVSHLTRDQWN